LARSTTIARLEEMIRWQADHERAELRHTSVAIRRAANQSIQRFREIISLNGHPYFLKSHKANMVPGLRVDPDSGEEEAWGIVDTSSFDPPLVRIIGVDVKINKYQQPLNAVEFGDRNDYQSITNESRFPIAFFGYDEDKIGILPAPSSDYPFTVWYIPQLAELTDDDDEFNPGLPGAEEWIVFDVMSKLLTRDNYPAQFRMVEKTKKDLMDRIIFDASAHQRANPPMRKDTRGRRRNALSSWYFWGQI